MTNLFKLHSLKQTPVRSLRWLIGHYPLRGQSRLIHIADRFLRRKPETISPIGNVQFPFLSTKGHALLFYGLYEHHVVEFLRQWLRPGDTFFDVGANVGFLTAIAANQVGRTGKIHAFEPEPNHYMRLLRLAQLNPNFNIKPNPAAISDYSGTISLLVSEHAGWHTTIPEFNYPTIQRNSLEVTCLTLDDYCQKEQLVSKSSIRLAKVDVEGAEQAVLRGAQNVLMNQLVDAFLVEVTPPSPERPVEAIEPLFETMQAHGYIAYKYSETRSTWECTSVSEFQDQVDILWIKQQISWALR